MQPQHSSSVMPHYTTTFRKKNTLHIYISQKKHCFYTIYLTRDSTAQHVCSPGAGFNPPEILSPCGLPVSCCLATSVVQLQWGPRGLPSPRIFMFLGGMKAAFVPSPSLRPWRPRRLDSADVDSRVWLASTRDYIAFAIPFMVQIHSGLGG